MIYVMTSKDGIFYEKIRLADNAELTTEQIKVDKQAWLNAPLPCKLINGEFIKTDEYPVLEFPEIEFSEIETSEINPEERIAILEQENISLNTQLTDTQLALCEIYETLLAIKEEK